MNRRDFITATAGVLATPALARLHAAAGTAGGPAATGRPGAAGAASSTALRDFFPRYPVCEDFEARVPIKRLATGRIIHRFFDTCPISPSGRYAALFRLPNENRPPQPGESGEVVLLDLDAGTERVVATSRGWEVQMGANVQWSPVADDLFFNDVDVKTWEPFAVRLDVATGRSTRLPGTVFTVSPDGKLLSSHNQIVSRRVQVGYGVVLPEERTPVNLGPVATDGIYVTDIARGECRLIASMKDIVNRAVPRLAIPNAEAYQFYCFQTRWNPQGTRLMTFLRWIVPGGMRAQTEGRTLALITMRTDGSDIRVAITAEQYARGGHHPMWTPDGEHLTLNLKIRDGAELDLVQVRYDNSELHSIHAPGSGHPSMHAKLPFVITDAYPREPVTRGDGTAPLRLIDLRHRTETALAQVLLTRKETAKLTSEHRIDAHPVWDRTGRYVIFNGVQNDTRSVFVADVGEWLAQAMARG